MEQEMRSESYLGEKLVDATSWEAPFHVENNVRTAGRLLQMRNLCSTICKGNLECRRLILEEALLKQFSPTPKLRFYNMASYRDYKAPRYLDRFNKLVAPRWPSHGYAYPSTVLPDRDPEFAANLLSLHSFECLGFYYTDKRALAACSKEQILELLQSPEVDSLLQTWKLNDMNGDGSSLKNQLLRLTSRYCH